MNTNLMHNIINITISLVAALTLFDWTAFFDPQTAMMIVGALSMIKLVINVIRDGVTGLVKEQPPVGDK